MGGGAVVGGAIGAGRGAGRGGDALGPALVLSLFVLIGNPLIVMAIMGYVGYRKRTGFMAGLTVAQISEFSIVFVAMGISLSHVDVQALGLTTLVGLVTITQSTYMILYAQPLYEAARGGPPGSPPRLSDVAVEGVAGRGHMNTTADEPRSLPPHAVNAATDFLSVRIADLAVQRAAQLAREQACPPAPPHVLSRLAEYAAAVAGQPPSGRTPDRGRASGAAARGGCPGGRGTPGGARLRRGGPTGPDAGAMGGRGGGAVSGVGGALAGGQRLLLGATAERLLRRAQCPVLVVRQSTAQPYQRVLLPVDFSPWSA